MEKCSYIVLVEEVNKKRCLNVQLFPIRSRGVNEWKYCFSRSLKAQNATYEYWIAQEEGGFALGKISVL